MTSKRVLIVDDEPDIRELLEITLGRMKVQTQVAADLTSAHQLLAKESFDLCLTDMQLPDGNGLDLVTHINTQHPDLPVAMITAFGSMDTAITALKQGAFDFLQKPIDLDQLRALVESALRMGDIEDSAPGSVRLLGEAKPMVELRNQIKKLARSQAPIYIAGESGSGKEVAARLVHAMGPRASGPFVPVNCGAIPSELMESEFFGHAKGSFTGAVSDKQGLFQAAAGGTLFLDEVADLPLSMQVKLLRAIQEKAVRPVGAHAEDVTDVRVLSATHKDLADEVATERFRQDLYYRLNVIELRIPALRDHIEDIELLAENALSRLADEYNQTAPALSEPALRALQDYDFPGNIRELENVLERAFTLCDNDVIEIQDLQLQVRKMATPQERRVSSDTTANMTDENLEPIESTAALESPSQESRSSAPLTEASHSLPNGLNLESYLEGIERDLITQALEASRWNKTAAAKALGISFRALRYKLKKLEME